MGQPAWFRKKRDRWDLPGRVFCRTFIEEIPTAWCGQTRPTKSQEAQLQKPFLQEWFLKTEYERMRYCCMAQDWVIYEEDHAVI